MINIEKVISVFKMKSKACNTLMSNNSNLIIDLHITTSINGKIKQKNNIKSITLSEYKTRERAWWRRKRKEETEYEGIEKNDTWKRRRGPKFERASNSPLYQSLSFSLPREMAAAFRSPATKPYFSLSLYEWTFLSFIWRHF